MRDPDLLPLDPDVQALVDGERAVPGAPGGARERVYAKLAATVGLAGAGMGAGAPVASVSGGVLKLSLVALVGALAGGGIIYALMRGDGSAPATVAATASAPSESSARATATAASASATRAIAPAAPL